MEMRNSCSVAGSEEERMNEFYVMGRPRNIDSLISNWKRNSLSMWYAQLRQILQITV
jgi:hypothetical protein